MPGQLNSFMFVISQVRSHLQSYPCPVNLNMAWNYGFLSGVFYFSQIITGVLLATRYTNDPLLAYSCVHHVLREVSYGWEIRYIHATGASALFGCLYIHIIRGFMYNSYLYLGHTWVSGIVIYLISIATGFLGYVLPWGQMSYWGATVICNLLSPLPNLVPWLLGGFFVDSPTLRRFFVIHFVLPLITLTIMILHIFFLHINGSSNPTGTDTALKVSFHPTMSSSDMKVMNYAMLLLITQVGFAIMELSHPDNSIEVNRFVTPLQIVPEWYFLAFYAVLKIIPSKTGGMSALLSGIISLFLFGDLRGLLIIVGLRLPFVQRNVASTWNTLFIVANMCLGTVGVELPQVKFISYGRWFYLIFIVSLFSLFCA